MASTPLTEAQITEALAALPGWAAADNALTKTYAFKAYLDGIAFAAAVGTLAEAHDHHPDLAIGWRKVTVRFTTHDAGSQITQKDVDAAAAIEGLGFPKPAA